MLILAEQTFGSLVWAQCRYSELLSKINLLFRETSRKTKSFTYRVAQHSKYILIHKNVHILEREKCIYNISLGKSLNLKHFGFCVVVTLTLEITLAISWCLKNVRLFSFTFVLPTLPVHCSEANQSNHKFYKCIIKVKLLSEWVG